MTTTKTEASKPATKILIVDDHPAIREALAVHIATPPDLLVFGEAAQVGEALRVADTTAPDVAIIDIILKTGSGIDLINRLKTRNKKLRAIIWSPVQQRPLCRVCPGYRGDGVHQQAADHVGDPGDRSDSSLSTTSIGSLASAAGLPSIAN